MRVFLLLTLLLTVISGSKSGDHQLFRNITSSPLDSINGKSYVIVKEIYMDQDVIINYPQISNFSDSNKQKKMNELIKNDVFKVFNDFKYENSKLIFEINYEIKYNTSNLISIQYIGYFNTKSAAHPTNLFFTTNVNIDKGSKVKLKELININDHFIEKFKKGKYKTWDPDLNLESEGVLNYIFEDYSNQKLLTYFNTDESYFYFTKDSLGISISVAHAIGDHVEMEMRYKDIADNINNKNEVWKDFMTK